MLIPNFGPYKLLPYDEGSIIQQSENDTEERPFSVIVFLEDSRARTKHVYLSFDEQDSFHVKTDEHTINFYMEKNKDGFLVSLLGGCFTTSHKNAFEIIYPHIQGTLSQWCFKYKRPIGIYETRIFDKKNKATWGIPHASPNTIPIIEYPMITLAGTTLTSLVSVFREGMNSQSSGNRFLNYYKILEAYPSSGPFRETNLACKNKGISNPRSIPRVTEELLLGAYKDEYHEIFLGKKFTWCREQLTEFRNALAHPFLKKKGYIDLDNLCIQSQLSAYANLLERIALTVLNEEFELWGKLSDDPNYTMMSQSYLGLNRKIQLMPNGKG